MNNTILSNAWRFIFLVLLQVLIFQRLSFGWENFNYINVIIFPIFILLLPFRTPSFLVVFLGFLIGISVDLFYDSPGVHASASVFMAWIRPAILGLMEPRGGYDKNQGPAKKHLGINWFFTYSSAMIFAYLFFYFSVEAFTFVYIVDIFLRTVFSFLVSMIFILAYQYLFDPGE